MSLTLALDGILVLTLPVIMFLMLLVVVGSRPPRFLSCRWRRGLVRYLLCVGWTMWLRLLNMLGRAGWLCGRVYGGGLLLDDLLLVRDRRRDIIRLFRWPLSVLACTEAL